MLNICPYCGADAHPTGEFDYVEPPPEMGAPAPLQRMPIIVCEEGHRLPPPV